MNGCRLRASDGVERYRLIGIAPKASNLQVEVSGIDRVTDCRRRLCRSFVAKHATIPRLASQLVGLLARFPSAFGRHLYLGAEQVLAGFGGHGGIEKAQRHGLRKLSICWALYR